MPWLSRLLRGDRVYARVGTDGKMIVGPDGRVDIAYGLRAAKLYRAAEKNLAPDPSEEFLTDEDLSIGAPVAKPAKPENVASRPSPRPSGAAAGTGAPAKSAGASGKPPIIVYADGACSGNPGPAGLGVVILDGAAREEISEYLGVGTNNIAELMALVRGMERVPRDRTVILHSDSAYALGLLGKGWKAKANQDLVQRMRTLAAGFADLRLVKVAGHAGIVENERADALARDAVTRKR